MNGNCCAEDVEKYDATTDTWRLCKPLLTPRKLHGLAALDGSIFAFGGAGHDESLIRSAECYNPELDAWSPLPDLPADAYASAAAAAGAIYVFLWGKFVARYDPAARRYQRLGPLPLPEYFGFATVAVGPAVYVLGGQSKGRRAGLAFRYEPSEDAWHPLPPMRMVRRRCAAAACRAPAAPTPAAAAEPQAAAAPPPVAPPPGEAEG
jgi:hypothetical protein